MNLKFFSDHLYTFAVVALVVPLVLLVWSAQPRPRLTPGKLAQIQQGMTEEQVEKILGFGADTHPPVPPPGFFNTVGEPPVWKEWSDNETVVVIGFVDGKVRYYPGRRPLLR